LRLARRVAALPRYRAAPWMGWGTFGVHQPALDQFPYALWARLLQRHGRRPPVAGEVRMHPLGLDETRAAIAGYLRTARGVRCEPEQILLVSGSQQALDLCARVLCEPGDAVWMEEPGYWLAREAFLSAGCRLFPAPLDESGVHVPTARRLPSRARLAYVTPAHQYPLGATLAAARRFALLRWARAAQAWILEDDYDGEFRYDAQPVAALQSLDADARVIYIGTFSKVLFPTLRFGYLVLPRDLVEGFVAVRRASDISPPHLIQTVIAEFIREGHFARHIQRMRRLYRERRAALAAQLAAQLPDWRIQGSDSGLHLALTPPCALDDIAACTRAAAAGLHAWPLEGVVDPEAGY
ncbi:MAG: PLP-dependent aminotransferase family protein, partial [Terriglobales bacterium]